VKGVLRPEFAGWKDSVGVGCEHEKKELESYASSRIYMYVVCAQYLTGTAFRLCRGQPRHLGSHSVRTAIRGLPFWEDHSHPAGGSLGSLNVKPS
jgi:hypothetical protein